MKTYFVSILLFISLVGFAQQIPSEKVISNNNLAEYLTTDVQKQLKSNGVITEAALASYFREKFSERYFYNWKNFQLRFDEYQILYPEMASEHSERALDHISKFSDSTQWVLPFNYLNGDPVNAYALRHLARQHKMVDIAFYYNYQNKNTQYISYFTNQLTSLNAALHLNEYEKIEDGNGVYEAFRSGYRVLNWLQIYNMFLGEEAFSDTDQLTTIATLLQHGANLYATNTEFVPGNHQTRGMSALAMLSILFRDFEGTDAWYNRSMKLLGEHLNKEINDDGFQFERSVHYHMSDIENYYFVYQLAKISEIKVEPFWEEKLRSLFTTLTKIAYPDKSAPVLQDDTDNPWAELNDISGALTLGYLLFEDPEFGYFSKPTVASKMYWYLSESQLLLLNNIQQVQPEFLSISFPTTGYYVQRNGWELSDNVMMISAGLDDEKPDHQHGDMLGVQAMANGKVILPNYQVRYSLPDYDFFKNSMVKNVALVDNEMQGKQYTSNQGGSGFGKFLELPQPKVIAWQTFDNYDLFVGAHNGFNNIEVAYTRQVINIKNDFWIVKDNFKSNGTHTYKQVWQGHYTFENGPNLIRSTFYDASGFDIFQLQKIDSVQSSGTRGKQWSVLSKTTTGDFSFVTVLFPYQGFDNRINELETLPNLKGWKLNASNWVASNANAISLTKENESYWFGVKKLQYNNKTIELSEITDVYINTSNNKTTIQLLGNQNVKITVKE
jgi:hypothetical protein